MSAKRTKKPTPKQSVSKQTHPVSAPVPDAESNVTSEPSTPVVQPVPSLDAPLAMESQSTVEGVSSEAQDRKNKRIFLIGLVGSLAIILTAGIVFVYYVQTDGGKHIQNGDKIATVTPTLPVATPTPSFNRASVTIEVLNGSGVAGAAATAAETLTQAGYTVVKTGNTSRSKSRLLVAPGYKDAQTLFTDLSPIFDIAEIEDALTGTTATARLIVGKKE